jgi:hypothetical protein
VAGTGPLASSGRRKDPCCPFSLTRQPTVSLDPSFVDRPPRHRHSERNRPTPFLFTFVSRLLRDKRVGLRSDESLLGLLPKSVPPKPTPPSSTRALRPLKYKESTRTCNVNSPIHARLASSDESPEVLLQRNAQKLPLCFENDMHCFPRKPFALITVQIALPYTPSPTSRSLFSTTCKLLVATHPRQPIPFAEAIPFVYARAPRARRKFALHRATR